MKHLISSRTALCLCGLTLCFNASAQGYVSYNHDAAKMNQITSSKVTYTVYQLVMRILVQIWAFYNDAF